MMIIKLYIVGDSEKSRLYAEDVEDATAEQVDHMRGLAENFHELARLANENFVATQNTSVAIERQKKMSTGLPAP